MNTANTSVHGNEKENLNRDEFSRGRCYTAAESQAARDNLPGLTLQEAGQTVPEDKTPPNLDPGVTEAWRRRDQVTPSHTYTAARK